MQINARSSARLLAVLAAGTLALTACGGGSEPAATNESGVALINEGTLTMCSDIPYKPFEFVENGENVGFDVDLAKEFAADLGVELQIITTAFEAIQSGTALNTDQCDVAVSGISITDERRTVMAFTDPYLDDNLALMVTKDSGIQSIADLQDKIVGVQDATTGKAYAEEQGLETRVFEDTGLVRTAIETGQVDAVINNISVNADAVSSNDNLELVEEYETGEQLGAAVKQGNTALLDSLNGTLERLESSGRLEELKGTWLGTN
jgi:polar amino acid transport system substrate-binding protein